MAIASTWTDADTQRALDFWREYQKQHDVTDRRGQVVAIDADSGRVWFGAKLSDVAEAARAAGVDQRRLLGLRVGFDYYQRKGGRR